MFRVRLNGLTFACVAGLLIFLATDARAASTSAVTQPASSHTLYQQRAAYRKALDQLTTGRTGAFREERQKLLDYPLLPYLEYFELRTRLSSVTDDEMHDFRRRHGDLPVTDMMFRRWLERLGSRREWARFLKNYEPSDDVELQCYRLRALLGVGQDDEAYAETGPLWTVGRSQPKACDPLFEAWIDADQLTEGRVWERMQLTLLDNQRQLARYLLRFFQGPLKVWAESLYAVHLDPASVLRHERFAADNEYQRVIIAHGLRRLARSDAAAAREAWRRYQQSHEFDQQTSQSVDETIILAEARDGRFPKSAPAIMSDPFRTDMAEAAIRAENWAEAVSWIERLPGEEFNSNRWQYWLARALSRVYLGSERARLTYRALAEERDYYGFLAAEQTGQEMQLNRAHATLKPDALAELQRVPAIARMLELYAVGDTLNARREWFKLLPTLGPDDQLHAAYLAARVGWISESIQIANTAGLRDSVDLRFPVAYPNIYQQVSHVTTVPQPFLLAISRQESLFDPRARSSANARGLMQLLHSTAVSVAERAGMTSPTTTDLYDPVINVSLGGHYLAHLLIRYGDRRPLAAAAYNAGEHRVDRWIANASGKPMDLWIEEIPFRETRSYVKNVMAFAQVYGQLLGERLPMLQVHEASVP